MNSFYFNSLPHQSCYSSFFLRGAIAAIAIIAITTTSTGITTGIPACCSSVPPGLSVAAVYSAGTFEDEEVLTAVAAFVDSEDPETAAESSDTAIANHEKDGVSAL